MAFFNDEQVPKAQCEYVLWLDIMGTKEKMLTSVKTSTIFICKLHSAILEAMSDDMHIYPVMDGAYVTSPNEQTILDFISTVFDDLAKSFVNEKNNLHRFIIKGALAHGPVVHGSTIPTSGSYSFEGHREYLDKILLGSPMIHAVRGEKEAPPFGIYCDTSSRMQSEKLCYRWHKWQDKEQNKTLGDALIQYFEYCKNHSFELNYDNAKIETHEKMCRQYFEIK